MQRVVGRVLRAHGIKGEVTVDVRTDEPDRRFTPGAVLATEPQVGSLTVAAARPHGGRLLVVFDEVADRSAAERLRGTLLLAEVSADDRPDEPDEYYDHQLVGLEVVTGTGAPVGQVAEMVHLPGQDLVAVRTPGGSEVLVPFVAEIVTAVDLSARRMVVEPPEGLLDLAYPEEG